MCKKLIIGSFLIVLAFVSTSCASKGKAKQNDTAQQVEKLQNSSEYSAVESEWNEMYQ